MRKRFRLPRSAIIGFGDIDKEHLSIVEHLNTLADALTSGKTEPLEIARLCKVFEDVTLAHFASEERAMAATGYPGLEEHREFHRAIGKKIGNTLASLATRTRISQEEARTLFAAVIDDVLRGDLDFREHLEGLGLVRA